MDEARKAKFQMLLDETRQDIKGIEEQIEAELAKVKERLAGLQREKEAQLTVYDGLCRLLNVPNDMASDDDVGELE